MRNIHLHSALVILFLSLFVVSVSAAGYSNSPPLIGVKGAPALNGDQDAGVFTFFYANGRPATLGLNEITLLLCASKCVTVSARITQIAIGTYAYSFTIPSLSGAVTIFIPAGSLMDDYGRPCPNIDVQIGAYTTPSASSSAGRGAPPASPEQPTPKVIHEAVSQEVRSETKESPTNQILLMVVLVTLGACGIIILPSKKG